MMVRAFIRWTGLALALGATAEAQDDRRNWTIHADVVHTVSGDAIEDGVVRVDRGQIAAVAAGAAEGADLSVAAVTPGMIDLSVRIDLGMESVEQSREVAPDMRASDAVNLYATAFERQARSGVTTVLVNPHDRAVIGGYGTLIKTAGPDSVAARTVDDECVMRAAMGSLPSRGNMSFGRPDLWNDFRQRRPTTRMGVEWVLRKAFYDTAYAKEDDSHAFPGYEELARVLDGEVPLQMQAWTTQDIRTSIFLKEEIEREGLGEPRMILDAAAEAWREPELLKRSGASVVLPPHSSTGRTTDGAFQPLDLAQSLRELGVTIALSSHGATEVGQRLDRQAGLAMRGGLSFEEALEAVTLAPAEMVGVDDRIGSIDVGKDADLVLWSGPPFELTTRVVGVLVDGRLILDPRPTKSEDS